MIVWGKKFLPVLSELKVGSNANTGRLIVERDTFRSVLRGSNLNSSLCVSLLMWEDGDDDDDDEEEAASPVSPPALFHVQVSPWSQCLCLLTAWTAATSTQNNHQPISTTKPFILWKSQSFRYLSSLYFKQKLNTPLSFERCYFLFLSLLLNSLCKKELFKLPYSTIQPKSLQPLPKVFYISSNLPELFQGITNL